MTGADVARLGALLSAEEARAIAASLRQVKLPHVAAKRAYGVNRAAVRQLLQRLLEEDRDVLRMCALLEGMASVPQVERPTAVWTSPSVPGSGGHTTLAALDLVNDANAFVYASTYSAAKNSPQLMALRNALDRGIKVTVVVDVKAMTESAALVAKELKGARIWMLAEPEGGDRPIQHSKLVTVDDSAAFVSSANFSVAGAKRSLECGILSKDSTVATSLRQHLDNLHTYGVLVDLDL